MKNKLRQDKKMNVVRSIQELFRFLRMMGVVPYYFYFAMICTVLAGFVNLIGVRLIYSLVKGIVRGDFAGAHDKFGLVTKLVQQFPESFQGSTLHFLVLIALIYGSVLLKAVLDFVATLNVDKQIQKANLKLKETVVERHLHFGKLYYDQTPMENIYHAVMSCPEIVTQQLLGLHMIATQMLTFAVYVGVMLWISLPLTLVCFLTFPIFNLGTNWLVEKIRASIHEQEAGRRRLQNDLFGMIGRMMLIKAHASEAQELLKFRQVNEMESGLSFKTQVKQHLLEPLEEVSNMTALLLVAFATTIVSAGVDHANLTSILIFFFFLRRAMPSFQILNRVKLSLASAADAFRSLDHVFSDQEKFMMPDGTESFKGLRDAIQIRQLTFNFPGRHSRTLDKVDFEIKKGQMTALVGASGAGKSTLVHLIMRFYDCLPGMILFDGKDIRSLTRHSLIKRMAFVGQDPLLLSASLRENLIYGLSQTPSRDELMSAVQRACLFDLVSALPKGLETPVGERGAQLSGGERQRIAIARALLRNAEILFLDEATSALDSITESLIQKALTEVIRGRTTVAIAHRLSTIRNADQIVVIEQGRLKEKGTPEELVEKKGLFWQYLEAQQFFSAEDAAKGVSLASGSSSNHS